MELLTFRKASEADAASVLELESYADTRVVSAYTKADEVLKYLQTSHVYLMYLQEKLIGDVSYERKSPAQAYIDGLNVRPEFRGQGFGGKALQWLLSGELAPYERIELTVHPRNVAALVIYLKLGFVIDGWKDDFYGDGQPRLCLAKE